MGHDGRWSNESCEWGKSAMRYGQRGHEGNGGTVPSLWEAVFLDVNACAPPNETISLNPVILNAYSKELSKASAFLWFLHPYPPQNLSIGLNAYPLIQFMCLFEQNKWSNSGRTPVPNSGVWKRLFLVFYRSKVKVRISAPHFFSVPST